MHLTKLKTIPLGLALLLSGTALGAAPAAAQLAPTPYKEDAGTALTRHLRTLSEQPRSLQALTGAGKAALELGDPQAALTFFARAEEIAPRDGRVKAGMGSAFLAMEQPRTALRFFNEAQSLGIAEAEFAGDRGLVHDLNGDPRRAQADYTLALSRQEDDEVRRRLALSLAISGDRDRALAAIDAQIRRQDRAAWRTRAFIMALSGDTASATQVAQSAMPAQAGQLQPFFAALPALSPAQRAMAVHFGHFPNDGQAARPASTQYASAAPTGTTPTRAGKPDPRQRSLGAQQAGAKPRPTRTATPTQTARVEAPRQQRSARAAQQQRRVQTAAVTPPRVAKPRVTYTPTPTPTEPTPAPSTVPTQSQPTNQFTSLFQPQQSRSSAPAGPPVEAQPSGEQSAALSVNIPTPKVPSGTGEAVTPATTPVETANSPPSAVTESSVATAVSAAPAAAATPSPSTARSLADIAAALETLSDDVAARNPAPKAEPVKLAEAPKRGAEAKPKPPEPKPTAKPTEGKLSANKESATKKEADAKKENAAKKEAASEKGAAPKEPSRHWVQIAGGANEAAMTSEFKRLKGKAPKLLGAMAAWTTPLRATNRLLVGPFKTPKEAQEFVNELAKLDLSAFSWTSPAGQEIVKLAAK